VEATVNGSPASVVNRIGWPGTRDMYRIDIAMPGGLAAGAATLSLSVAWMPVAEYRLAVK
jgi:hypothetical protein